MSMRARSFVNTVVSVVLALALYVLVLAVSQQNHHVFDLTQNRRHTLSQQSIGLVKGLDRPIKLWVFLLESDKPGRQKAEDLLERYRQNNKGNFTYEIVDPVVRNALAKMFEIRQPGQGVVEFLQSEEGATGSDARRERISSVDEAAITNALLKLTRQRELKACFLTGHGEADLEAQESHGLSGLKAALVKEGYQVAPLQISESKKVPDDCDVLVVAGPRAVPIEAEQAILKQYLSGTGRALFLINPDSPAYWAELLAGFGFELPAEVVVDAQSEAGNPLVATGVQFDPGHAITANFQVAVYFLLTRPVDVGKPAEGAELVSLVKTGPAAAPYPMEQALSRKAIEFDASKARPISLMAAGTYPKEKPKKPEGKEEKTPAAARIAVAGNADFVTNQLLNYGGNQDLALNTFNWLSESEEMITIRPKEDESQPVMLSASHTRWMFLVHVLFIPLVVVLVGVLTAMRRR